MTRINTNVSSLVAQNRLNANNEDLNTALTRLSTGLRINSGSDDPAGLIAAESLRSEITGIGRAITNTERASQIISTADSALGQVSSLLNDVRGLVAEAANSGALSDEEIAANQLQIDSSLEAINRISQTTTFQGRRLLDGSLDFSSDASSVSSLANVDISRAQLGSASSIDVDVNVQSAAEQASVDVSSDAFATATTDAVGTSEVSTNTLSFAIGGETITVRGNSSLSSFALTQNDALGAVAAESAGSTASDIVIEFDGDSDASTAQDVLDALNGIEGIVATTDGDGSTNVTTAVTTVNAAAGQDIGIEVTASNEEQVAITFTQGTDADVVATFDADANTLNVALGTTTSNNTLANIVTQIGAETGTSAQIVDAAGDTLTGFDDLTVLGTDLPADATAQNVQGGLQDDLVFQLTGNNGSETFNFSAGATESQIAAAVNLVSDSTGITADATDGLSFSSQDFGSDAQVSIEIISEGDSGTFAANLSDTRTNGTDIAATVNGIQASGNGNRFSISTSALAVDLTVNEGSTEDFSFSITGGGATFQLGPSVSSQQQATLGISSVNTGSLGGASGRLNELGSGQARSLANDVEGAAQIIDEVIGEVTALRGRLGAFQSTTLASNLVSLGESRANLQEAESSIRDADFAQESANLTRAQILVQSGTNVLALANQNPQNALALLG